MTHRLCRQILARTLFSSHCFSALSSQRFQAATTTSYHNRRITTIKQHTAMSATTTPATTNSTSASNSSSAPSTTSTSTSTPPLESPTATPLFAPKSAKLYPAAIPNLAQFYQQSQQLLKSATHNPNAPPITIVMGNESSDFDSTVAASVTAWYLNALSQCSTVPSAVRYCPVINVPRRYFHLRTEIAAEYTRLGIDVKDVTFLDDVELRSVKAHSAQFGVVMVDHNQLTESQHWMDDDVVAVVDHHVDEALYPKSTPNRVMGRVGSCCTHVTNIIRDNHPELLSSRFDFLPIVQLLTDVILIDTHNLNPDAKKVTPPDTAAIAYLTQCNHTLLFTQLKALRNDVKGWSTEDLLLKDTKLYNNDGYGVMISTVPLPLDEWVKQDADMVHSLARCAKDVDALIVLTSYTDKQTKAYKRDLLLIAPKHPPSVTQPHPAADNRTVSADGGSGSGKSVKVRLSPEELFERLARGLESDDKLRLRVIDSSRQVSGLSDGERSTITGLGAVELSDGMGVVKEDEHGVLVRRYDQQNVSSSRKQVAPAVEAILSKL